MSDLNGFKIKRYVQGYFEVTVWISALVLLAFMTPVNQHASLCVLKNAGLGFCPGCGLGHSISWLFRGDFVSSFHAHPLGSLAVIVLLIRIYTLLKKPIV